jgi:hypothetical protein
MDFPSFIGPTCPLCGKAHRYRQITPYWRYATELFPEFQKKRIPIARFLCPRRGRTFSLLPIQLIPYFQYTASAVLGTLLLGLGCWQAGRRGFHGACEAVDPDSLLTPWLVACWLMVIVKGLRRAHATLRRWYDLSPIRTPKRPGPWEEISGYFLSLGWKKDLGWPSLLRQGLHRYSRTTRHFLFGTPSQERRSR